MSDLVAEYEENVSNPNTPRLSFGNESRKNEVVIKVCNRNASENSVDSPPAPPRPPNVDEVQAQIQARTLTAEQARQENAPPNARQENALPNGVVTYFTIGAQVSITVLTALHIYNDHPLSHKKKILRDIAVGSNMVGYVSLFNSTRISRHLATQILKTIACAAFAFAYLSSMGMLLPENINLWVTLLACALCLPGLAEEFKG